MNYKLLQEIQRFSLASLKRHCKQYIKICSIDDLYIDSRVLDFITFRRDDSRDNSDDNSDSDSDSDDSSDGEIIYFDSRIVEDKIKWKRDLATEWSKPFDEMRTRLKEYSSMNILANKISFDLISDLKFAVNHCFNEGPPSSLQNTTAKFYDVECPDDTDIIQCADGELMPVLKVCYNLLKYSCPINFIIIYKKSNYDIEYV